uniref:Uncharacterized protein n=2 Tax=Oryza punctata TaxID=4537 RepID=A0A0E0M7R3_ORYPU
MDLEALSSACAAHHAPRRGMRPRDDGDDGEYKARDAHQEHMCPPQVEPLVFLGPPPLPNSAAAMPGPKTLMQLKAMQQGTVYIFLSMVQHSENFASARKERGIKKRKQSRGKAKSSDLFGGGQGRRQLAGLEVVAPRLVHRRQPAKVLPAAGGEVGGAAGGAGHGGGGGGEGATLAGGRRGRGGGQRQLMIKLELLDLAGVMIDAEEVPGEAAADAGVHGHRPFRGKPEADTVTSHHDIAGDRAVVVVAAAGDDATGAECEVIEVGRRRGGNRSGLGLGFSAAGGVVENGRNNGGELLLLLVVMLPLLFAAASSLALSSARASQKALNCGKKWEQESDPTAASDYL